MKFGKKLESLKNKEIAVVMIDGYIYRGILADHDDEMLILTHVDETNNDSMDWKAAEEELTETEVNKKESKSKAAKTSKNTKSSDKGKDDKIKDDKRVIKWRPVALPEVIIRLPMVLRIWPWNVLTKEDLEKSRKNREEKQVYFMSLMGLNM